MYMCVPSNFEPVDTLSSLSISSFTLNYSRRPSNLLINNYRFLHFPGSTEMEPQDLEMPDLTEYNPEVI